MLSRKLKGSPGQFQGSDFTATKWHTAEDKARIANKLTKFILNGFQRGSFTKVMYRRLSNMFGHIAEYNLDGFYSVWFEDDETCLKWAENAATGYIVGDPAWTWSDVEGAIRKWIIDNQVIEQISRICSGDNEPAPFVLVETPIQEQQMALL